MTKTKVYRLKAHGGCSATTVRITFDPRDKVTVPVHARATFVQILSGYVDWTALVPCEGCGRTFRVSGTPVRGRVNLGRPCDGRCRNATGGDCECACGGEQHGINHA